MDLSDLPPTAPAILRTLRDNPRGISGQQLHTETEIPMDEMWRILVRMIDAGLAIATVRGLQLTPAGRERVAQLLPAG